MYERLIRVQRYKRWRASLKPPHNASKMKALAVLVCLEEGKLPLPWDSLTAREVSELSGIPLQTAKNSLPKWSRWHITIQESRTLPSGLTIATYRIDKKGAQWFHRWSPRIRPPELALEWGAEIQRRVQAYADAHPWSPPKVQQGWDMSSKELEKRVSRAGRYLEMLEHEEDDSASLDYEQRRTLVSPPF